MEGPAIIALAATSGIGSLAVLACPIGMGVCMWMMMRGNKKGDDRRPAVRHEEPSSLDELREEQRRLAAEIDRLEDVARTPSQEAPARR